MAGRQDISMDSEIVGQSQLKRDEMNQAFNAADQEAKDKPSMHDHLSAQTAIDLKDQAANFLQQTGEQVKNMAQGAAEAVKNTLGMNTDNSPNPNSNTNTNSPSNNPST